MERHILHGWTQAAGNAGDLWHLRQAASEHAPSLGLLAPGTPVTLLEGPYLADDQEWWWIRTGEDAPRQGWVTSAALLRQVDEEQLAGGRTRVGGASGTGPWNLRARPGVGGRVIATVPTGAGVCVLAGPARADGYRWWYVRTLDDDPAGLRGWMVSASLQPLSPLRRAIVRAALAHIGYDLPPAIRRAGDSTVAACVSVEQIAGDYARVTLFPTGGGERYDAFLQRESGIWRHLASPYYAGQPDEARLRLLGIPRALW